jgi:hypothetical protein
MKKFRNWIIFKLEHISNQNEFQIETNFKIRINLKYKQNFKSEQISI